VLCVSVQNMKSKRIGNVILETWQICGQVELKRVIKIGLL